MNFLNHQIICIDHLEIFTPNYEDLVDKVLTEFKLPKVAAAKDSTILGISNFKLIITKYNHTDHSFAMILGFLVDDVDVFYRKAIRNGGKSVLKPFYISSEVKIAEIEFTKNILIRYVRYSDFKVRYLPGYKWFGKSNNTIKVDHIGIVVADEALINKFAKMLDLHVETNDEFSEDKPHVNVLTKVVSDPQKRNVITFLKPLSKPIKHNSNLFLDKYGSGVHHLALRPANFNQYINSLNPKYSTHESVSAYYKNHQVQIILSSLHRILDTNFLIEHGILVSSDEDGYLLQKYYKLDNLNMSFEIVDRIYETKTFGQQNMKTVYDIINKLALNI